eukprot:tig00020943_g16327.t1
MEQLSIGRLAKAVRDEEMSLFARLASIEADALFVDHVRVFYGFPLFANKRAGVWYCKQADGTAYFKSTDGHVGSVSLSLTRINLHVVIAAAERGGVVIADSTRRGKRFPDSLRATVPVWAAAVNRVVGRLRRAAGREEGPWDDALHLPPWVPPSEADELSRRIDGWADALQGTRVDFSRAAEGLRKPLRCIWVAPDAGSDFSGRGPDPEALECTPVVCVSASRVLGDSRARMASSYQYPSPPISRPTQYPLLQVTPEGYGFTYVQGAGDDEENWSLGLTAPLFWRRRNELLSDGPAGCEERTAQVLTREAAEPSWSGAAHPPAGPSASASAASRLCAIGSTGLVLAPAAAAAALASDPPALSSFAGVVNLGAFPHPLYPHTPHPDPGPEEGVGTPPGSLPALSGDQIYLPLPHDDKKDRHSLENALPALIDFAWRRLARGGRLILFSPDEGAAVCSAAALLLACFDFEYSPLPYGGLESLYARIPIPGGKAEVRRRLVHVSSFLPEANPPKALALQVNRFFLTPRELAKTCHALPALEPAPAPSAVPNINE